MRHQNTIVFLKDRFFRIQKEQRKTTYHISICRVSSASTFQLHQGTDCLPGSTTFSAAQGSIGAEIRSLERSHPTYAKATVFLHFATVNNVLLLLDLHAFFTMQTVLVSWSFWDMMITCCTLDILYPFLTKMTGNNEICTSSISKNAATNLSDAEGRLSWLRDDLKGGPGCTKTIQLKVIADHQICCFFWCDS